MNGASQQVFNQGKKAGTQINSKVKNQNSKPGKLFDFSLLNFDFDTAIFSPRSPMALSLSIKGEPLKFINNGKDNWN